MLKLDLPSHVKDSERHHGDTAEEVLVELVQN